MIFLTQFFYPTGSVLFYTQANYTSLLIYIRLLYL
nr:MAG TPA: hypothetical protein [Caudoviricetes sp.]